MSIFTAHPSRSPTDVVIGPSDTASALVVCGSRAGTPQGERWCRPAR
jgi:hypothetical protein